ncbi:hypothetical protein [Spirosoma fluviale]|uniref:Uncharacterized protein n=1 Tax=Spirosoma fluviale TaxID=1597977 RepID=A0A286GQ31_9BACT|nr:hypothetical protein [Spirosoma fluviale]SOD97084.1 hypothetical protein SAMN06269250_5657 [Spirosoma fluviale]
MKTIIITLAMTLLIGVATVNAQAAGGKYSGNSSNAGRQGNSSQNNARKANTSQTMGNGVPYNKDAEQKRAIASGSTSTTGGPTVNRGQSASASAPATAKRNNSSGTKTGTKSGGTPPKGSGSSNQ